MPWLLRKTRKTRFRGGTRHACQGGRAGERALLGFVQSLIILALLAVPASMLRVYPHQLAYFNEFSGGPEKGYRHLLGSNLDWGQDLIYVKGWMNGNGINPDNVRILSSAFTYDPRHVLGYAPLKPRSRYEWEVISAQKLVDRVYPRIGRLSEPSTRRIGSAMWVTSHKK